MSNSSVQNKSKSKQQKSVKVVKKNVKGKNTESKEESSKFNRFANTEKGKAPNKQTSYINGFFNVNDAGNYMKSYISDTLCIDMNCISTKFPFSATVETLIHQLVSSSVQYAQKDDTEKNLYTVTAENLQRVIRENLAYGRAAKYLVLEYNPTARNYAGGFYIPAKTVSAFIESKVTIGKNNVQLTKGALNFLCYYVETIMCDITRTACKMAQVNGKSMSIKHFMAATEDHLTGEVGDVVSKRLNDIHASFTNKSEKKSKKVKDVESSDEDANNDNNDSENDESDDNVNKKNEENKSDDESDDDSD